MYVMCMYVSTCVCTGSSIYFGKFWSNNVGVTLTVVKRYTTTQPRNTLLPSLTIEDTILFYVLPQQKQKGVELNHI